MKFRVKFLPRADADVRAMLRYLVGHSQTGANAWVNALDHAVGRLEVGADTFSAAFESEHFEIDVKQLLFKTRRGLVYRLIYTIVGQEVRILRVRGPGQAPIQPDEADPQGVDE